MRFGVAVEFDNRLGGEYNILMLNRSKVSRMFFNSRQDMYGSLLVGLSFLALTFLTVKTFAPDVASNADTNTATAGSSSYSASISTNDVTSISVNPTDIQTVFTGQSNLIYTNQCPYGFTVTLSSADEDPSLIRTGSDSFLKAIPTISSGNALTDNTWGYSLDNGETYQGIPRISSPATIINTTSASVHPTSLNLTYGVKINSSIPSGAYSNDVIYTVAVKPQCLVYDLKWNLNGGTGASGASYTDQTINYGNTINLQNYTPTRTGYTFAGWKSSATNNTFPASATTTDVNPTNAIEVTLTAQWTPVNYTIAYTLNGGSATNPTSYNIETNTITLNNPTRANYTFAGWTGSNGTTKQTTVTIPKGSTGNKSYVANWTPTNYTISYTLNGGSASNPTSYNIESNAITLNNPTRANYVFTGWSGTGLSGSANKTVTIPKGSTGNRSYTANWRASTLLDISSMQQMTTPICSATTVGTSKNLTDTRDNNVYMVKKLKDGKCWMTQNLRLINKTISSSDSNLPSGSTWTIPASSIVGFTSYNANNAYIDSNYGGYYTFYTATAGWGTGGDGGVTSGSSSKDICPKGWRLPTGSDSGEFKPLYNKYNSVALMLGEPGFVLSGGASLLPYGGGYGVSSQGEIGWYWSSTAYGIYNAYYLLISGGDGYQQVQPTNYSNKNYGYAIRCVAK